MDAPNKLLWEELPPVISFRMNYPNPARWTEGLCPDMGTVAERKIPFYLLAVVKSLLGGDAQGYVAREGIGLVGTRATDLSPSEDKDRECFAQI